MMKKTIAILCMVLAVALCACDKKITTETTPATTEAQVTTLASTPSETTPVATTTEATTTATEATTTATEETTTVPETSETTEATTEATTVAETTQAPAPTTTAANPSQAWTETELVKTVYAHTTANIRSGPGTSYGKVRTTNLGDAMTVVAITNNNWYKLEDGTFISQTVVSDVAPTPVPTQAPTPTPDPNAPVPTPVPADTMTISQIESAIWSVVTSVRSGNGLTTNYSDILSTQCRKDAEYYAGIGALGHTGKNGNADSAGIVGPTLRTGDQNGWGPWHAWNKGYGGETTESLDEAVRAAARYLIVTHVPEMATNAEWTEFGVGVYKITKGNGAINYYIYISCASPNGLQCQIDMGYYN